KSYFIVILSSRKGECCGYFGYNFVFKLLCSSKELRTGNVNHKHHGELPFFLKNLYKGFVVASRHIPVNVSYVVSKLVLAYFAKGHSAPFKCRVVLSAKNMIG